MADRLNKQRLQRLHQREHEDKEHHRVAMPYLEQVPGLPERLEQALSSAFNDFPYCGELLLYMGMFPSGYKFEKDRLIWKWIHEGLIHSSVVYWELGKNVLHEAEGNSKAEWFFSQLVDRNVITCVASNCKHKQDEVDACQWQVNHFLQQFLSSKSAEMGFLFTTANLNLLRAALPATGHGSETRSRMPRRLAVHHPDPLLPTLLETMDLSQTRSLAVSGAVSGIPLEKFVNLVVLDLEGWENLKDEDLLQVCRSKMFFLTYLSVRNTRVSKLPHEIKKLQILSTLDVSHTQISKLPLELFQLKYLEHLDLRGTRVNQLPKQIVGLQDKLEFLLVGGEGTINSVETATRLPHDVRHLYLLTLATVDLTRHPASFVRALGDLYRLRVLAVTWSFHQSTDRDYCEALLSSIAKWGNLESLTIHCGLGCSMEFLGSLEKSRAPPGLKKFKVTAGRFARVPPWIHVLWRLAFVQITVYNKQTTTDNLKILGALPKLQCLILGLDFIPSQAIVIGNEGFRVLQRLSLHCVLPWFTFQTGAMPWLEHLRLKFSSGPASEDRVPSGITNLRRIREVVLSYSKWCVNSTSVKMTVKAVKEQVAKQGKPIDLFINSVEDDDVQAVDEEPENATGACSSRTDAGPGRDDAQAVDEEATGEAQTGITEAES
jgi:Leucine-rich repeat (LRR) protein